MTVDWSGTLWWHLKSVTLKLLLIIFNLRTEYSSRSISRAWRKVQYEQMMNCLLSLVTKPNDIINFSFQYSLMCLQNFTNTLALSINKSKVILFIFKERFIMYE